MSRVTLSSFTLSSFTLSSFTRPLSIRPRFALPPFSLACLTYLCFALAASTLGLLWPSMRLSLGQPVGALGLPLAVGVAASMLASTAVGRVLSRVPAGPLLAGSLALAAAALAGEALAPSLAVLAAGFAAFGVASGTADAVLNVYAAEHFGPRRIIWMHASYGVGATLGPLAVTATLGHAVTWRDIYGASAVALALGAVVLAASRASWNPAGPPPTPIAAGSGTPGPPARATDPDRTGRARWLTWPPRRTGSSKSTALARWLAPLPRRTGSSKSGHPGSSKSAKSAALLGGLAFVAAEQGIESGAGIWAYLFLTAGRGLSAPAAGVAVSAYGATMLAGRAGLGPVAERLGAGRVLAVAVAGIAAGAALLAGPGPVAVAGLLVTGLAAAPVFPLFTLTTAGRFGGGAAAARAVSLQVAASAAGSVALPAGLGLLIGSAGPRVLAPGLLLPALALVVVGGLLARAGRAGPPGER